MKFVRLLFVALASIAGMAFTASSAHAANHFLNAPVPVLANPTLNSNGGDYDLAMSDSGDSVAFWGQSNGMYAAVRPAGGKFGAPVLISPDAQGTALPAVSMTPTGQTILIWRQDDDANIEQVFASVRAPGSSVFSAPVQVSNESFDIPSVKPAVDMYDNGTAVIVWRGYQVDGDSNSSLIRMRYLSKNGGFQSSIKNVSPASATGNDFPAVAVGPSGDSAITYVVGDTITGDPAVRTAGPGDADADTQVFDLNSGSVPAAAVDSAGNTTIAYKADGGTLIGNHRPAGIGQNFLFDQAIDGPGTNNVCRPVIGMDAAGNTTVAFCVFKNADTKWSIQSVDRAAGANTLFGDTTQAADPSDDVEQVALGVGSGGAELLSWAREDDRFYAASRDAGASSFSPQTGPMSAAATDSGESHPVVDASGKGVVSYSSSPAGPPADYKIDALPYDDVPVASDLNIPATAVQGVPVQFSVAPTDSWADVTGTEWTLDPGVVKTGNQVGTTYMTAGKRTVSVKITDSLGNVTTATGDIDVKADVTPPLLTKVSIQKKKARVGKKNAFRFTTSDKSKIVITIKRTSKGKGKKNQGKIVKSNVAAGKRKIGFRGKVGKKRLKPARYKATLVAVDQFGNRSKPKSVGFRILGKK